MEHVIGQTPEGSRKKLKKVSLVSVTTHQCQRLTSPVLPLATDLWWIKNLSQIFGCKTLEDRENPVYK